MRAEKLEVAKKCKWCLAKDYCKQGSPNGVFDLVRGCSEKDDSYTIDKFVWGEKER